MRARLGVGRVEGLDQRVQRLGAGAQVDDVPDRLLAGALLLAQRREQAGEDDRGLAAAGAAEDGDDIGGRALADLGDQLVDEALAAEEQAGVLLAERQQAAIGAQAAARSRVRPSMARPWAAAIRRCRASGSSRPGRRSTQVLRLRKVPSGTSSGCRPGSRTGMTGNGVAVCSAAAWRSRPSWISRCCQPPMPAGPSRTTRARQSAERGLQLRLPGLAAGERVAVEEGLQAGVGEAGAQLVGGCGVGAAVAQEDVVGGGDGRHGLGNPAALGVADEHLDRLFLRVPGVWRSSKSVVAGGVNGRGGTARCGGPRNIPAIAHISY